MRIAATIIGGLVLGMASTASAQTPQQVEARKSRAYAQCMDASGGVTVEMLDCYSAETANQDGRLNQAYKMVMARLTPAQKTTLRTSERNWITQRDARCQRKSDVESGGSLAQVIFNGCVLDETIKRTIWLEHYKG